MTGSAGGDDGDRVAVEARIVGHVQGVAYRAWTRGAARGLGLAGWVRNEPDGSVRAVFAGPPEAVRRMLAACRRGPRSARVERVETREVAPPAAKGFEITR